jgi:hypothetical protein
MLAVCAHIKKSFEQTEWFEIFHPIDLAPVKMPCREKVGAGNPNNDIFIWCRYGRAAKNRTGKETQK